MGMVAVTDGRYMSALAGQTSAAVVAASKLAVTNTHRVRMPVKVTLRNKVSRLVKMST